MVLVERVDKTNFWWGAVQGTMWLLWWQWIPFIQILLNGLIQQCNKASSDLSFLKFFSCIYFSSYCTNMFNFIYFSWLSTFFLMKTYALVYLSKGCLVWISVHLFAREPIPISQWFLCIFMPHHGVNLQWKTIPKLRVRFYWIL